MKTLLWQGRIKMVYLEIGYIIFKTGWAHSTFSMKLLRSVPFLFLLKAIAFPVFTSAQTVNSINPLKEKLKQLQQQKNFIGDTAYANTLADLAYIYSYTYPDSALILLAGNAERCQAAGNNKGAVDIYMIAGDAWQTKGMYDSALKNYEASYTLAKHINYQKAFSYIQNKVGVVHLSQGNYPEALKNFYGSLKAAESANNNDLTGTTLNNIAVANYHLGKFDEADSAYMQRLKLAQQMNDSSGMSLAYNGLGEVSLKQNNPAKALENLTIAYDLALKVNDQEMMVTARLSMAEAYYESDSLQKAIYLFEDALQLSKQMDYGTFVCNALIGLAKARHKTGLLKEALANGLEALQKAESMGQVQLMRDANEIVSNIYAAMHDGNNALKYYRTYKEYSDSINNLESQRAAAIEKAGYEFSKKEIEFQRKALQQQWIIFSAFGVLILLVIILWLINRNRKRLNYTNKELQKKNEIIQIQKREAEETLAELKATQKQLIQSEKMASLGELTAGIAHEIQNPLNFVNNFSEISNELVDEMKEELETGSLQQATEIAEDIKQNLEKINYHGKRADSIVKAMLQHSRQSSGKKEPTDINALCDEYLRLSYHGLRAKDKTFNVEFTTDFDESVGKINIIPQDIGRVLLNLFNNAFYAVNEKSKLIANSYRPLTQIKTRRINDKVEIVVTDNGNGIPQNIVDKIFQPFFTTKPTGQGTGLGLSLSYDIIKAHSGNIKVKSKEGEGSVFIIQLPLS